MQPDLIHAFWPRPQTARRSVLPVARLSNSVGLCPIHIHTGNPERATPVAIGRIYAIRAMRPKGPFTRCARDCNSVYFNGCIHTFAAVRAGLVKARGVLSAQRSTAQRMCEQLIIPGLLASVSQKKIQT